MQNLHNNSLYSSYLVSDLRTHGKLSLNHFLRYQLNLSGTEPCPNTKCSGSCLAIIRRPHGDSIYSTPLVVNSCLIPLLFCADCEVETVEGLPQSLFQQLMPLVGKTFCANCATKVLMHLHCIMAKTGARVVPVDQVEKLWSESGCSCVGYKKELIDSSALEVMVNQSVDDVDKKNVPAIFWKSLDPVKIMCEGFVYHRVMSLEKLWGVIDESANKKILMLAGNSERLLNKSTEVQVLIDLNHVKELKVHEWNEEGLSVGGGVTIAEFLDFVRDCEERDGYRYLKEVVKYMEAIGTTALRNVS